MLSITEAAIKRKKKRERDIVHSLLPGSLISSVYKIVLE